MALGTSGLFVAAAERPSLELSAPGPTRLVVWTLDAEGRQQRETELKEFPAGDATNTRTIRDIEALPGGGALVLADFSAGRPSVVTLDAAGNQAATRRVLPDHREATLMRIVAVSNERYLLIGHERFDALAVLVDRDGVARWDRTHDRGRMEYFVDGLAHGDGGAVLVGNSGTYDAMRAGPSTVWVAQYDAAGMATREVTFGGRYGRITAAPDGGYAVVYDRDAALGRDVHLKRLGPDLQELWDTALVSSPDGVGDFGVGTTADGAFAVAGGLGGRAQVYFVDAAGRRAGEWLADAGGRAIDVGVYGIVTDANGGLFIATSHVEARSKTDVTYRVRVRRLARATTERGQ